MTVHVEQSDKLMLADMLIDYLETITNEDGKDFGSCFREGTPDNLKLRNKMHLIGVEYCKVRRIHRNLIGFMTHDEQVKAGFIKNEMS